MFSSTVQSLGCPVPGLLELTLDRNDVEFEPGDCVAIFNDEGTSRPYSIASGKDESSLRFLIRNMQGEVTQWLAGLRPGDTVRFSAPFGWFRPGRSGRDQRGFVFIATGTGIAPFVSFLKSFPDEAPLLCLYGVRHRADALEAPFIGERCPMTLCVSQDADSSCRAGRVTACLEEIPLDEGVHYYLCGLDAMIDDVSRWLEDRGVHFSRIHREVFFNA